MLKRVRLIGISAVIVIAIVAIIAFNVLQGRTCDDVECYNEMIQNCERGVYINEESEASWGYKIKGQYMEMCEIEVTLLQAKRGDLRLRDFEESSMTCRYPAGEIVFPEKDLTKCSGELKENLQSVLIENLHAYILDNLDDIKEGLLDSY